MADLDGTDEHGRRYAEPDALELVMLKAFLDYQRATLLWKADGVGDEDLRRPMVPSGLTLLGLVKHLAYVEQWWFQEVFGGREGLTTPYSDSDPDADFRIESGESTDEILDLYRRKCDDSRSAIGAASADDRAARPGRERYTLRWILNHMIEETARHNGHADIIREMIDGSTGE